MLTTHNVPYVLKCINDVFPYHKSGPNKVSCSASQSVCISHLLYDTGLFHKKAGTDAGQPGSRSGHRQILTWAAAADDIHGRKLGATQLRNIPDVNHVREPQLRYLDGKGFDLAGPDGHDAIADCRQREASDPIEKASYLQHGLQPH